MMIIILLFPTPPPINTYKKTKHTHTCIKRRKKKEKDHIFPGTSAVIKKPVMS